MKRHPRLVALLALHAIAQSSVATQLDRDSTPADVRLAVEQAKKIYRLYNAADNVMLDEPWDYNRLPQGTEDRVIRWMLTKMK